MSRSTLLSIIESPTHPALHGLYCRLGIEEVQANSMRKAIAQLKKIRPDWVVTQFFYGYGNNYAGAHISNLDVFLASLQKYASDCRVIVLVDKEERQYVDRLADRFPLYAVLIQPVDTTAIQDVVEAG